MNRVMKAEDIKLVDFYKPENLPLSIVSKKFPFDGKLYHEYLVYEIPRDVDTVEKIKKYVDYRKLVSGAESYTTFTMPIKQGDDNPKFLLLSIFNTSITLSNSFEVFENFVDNMHMYYLYKYFDTIIFDILINSNIDIKEYLSGKITNALKEFADIINSQGYNAITKESLHVDRLGVTYNDDLYSTITYKTEDLWYVGYHEYDFMSDDINKSRVCECLDEYYQDLYILDNRVILTNKLSEDKIDKRFYYGKRNENLVEIINTDYGSVYMFKPWKSE